VTVDLRDELDKVPKGHYRIVHRVAAETPHIASREVKRVFDEISGSLAKRSGPRDAVVSVQTLMEGAQILVAVTLVGEKRGWLR
jgi:hypothetical protein